MKILQDDPKWGFKAGAYEPRQALGWKAIRNAWKTIGARSHPQAHRIPALAADLAKKITENR